MKIAIQCCVLTFISTFFANPAVSIAGVDTPTPSPMTIERVTKDTPDQNPYGRLNPLLPKDFIPSSEVQKIDTRLIVVYKDSPTHLQRRNLLSPLTANSKEKVSLSQQMTLDILEFDSKSQANQALKALRASNLVESVNRDVIYQITAIPNDPDYEKTWGMQQMNVPTAWNTTKGSADIVVGVIDTGIDLDHPDLVDNLWVNEDEIPDNGIDDDSNGYIDDVHGWDFVNDDNVPNDDVTSDHWASGHGTHVAGTIAGVGNNNIGVAGVAWQAKLMGLKICGAGGCSLTDHVLALQYAYNNGAQIVNESFGGGYEGYDWERDAIAAVSEPGTGEQKGILVVAAGGNNGANTEINKFHPANYRLDNHISVAATESNGSIASFSNYSVTNIDVAAPGSGIWSTLPEEGAFNQSGGYGYLSGTSMAAPHVAGVAVLIQASHPTWKPSDIRKALIATVQENDAVSQRVFSGGIVDAAAAVALSSVPSSKLLIRQIGTGTGIVQSSGILCNSSTCRINNTGELTFNASASVGSIFNGWFGLCTGEADCTFTTTDVSPILSAKFSEPADPNISVTLLESSPSTPAFTNDSSHSSFNITNTKLSADGSVRAKAVWRSPYWCNYLESDTGGVTIERNIDGTWVEEAKFTAPSLDESRAAGRFANCELFGREMHLSDDGNTLSVLLGAYINVDLPNPENDYIICGAAVYRKQNDGAWSDATLLTPADKYDCLKTIERTPESMGYWNGARSMTMSDDGNVVFVSSAGKILKFDITNLGNIVKSVYELPNNCIILTSNWNQWFNLSSDYSGTTLVIPTSNCTNSADSYVLTLGSSNSFKVLPATPFANSYVAKTAMSEDGSLIALSYRELELGVVIFEKVGSTWVERRNLNSLPGFEGYVNCLKFSDDKLTLLCDSQFTDVGRNSQQGKVLVYLSDSASWSESVTQTQYWATLGSPFDWASVTTATDDVMKFDTNISGNSIGINYADTVMGSTFDIATSPVFTHTPEVNGVPSVGASLTASNVGVRGVSSSSVNYQWYQCTSAVNTSTGSIPNECQSISGAIAQTFTTNSSQLNKYVIVAISAENELGSALAVSRSTGAIKNTAVLTKSPTLSGTPAVSQTLRTSPGSWKSSTRVSYTYQWQRCVTSDVSTCSNISRATKSSYKLTTSDAAKYIRAMVSARNSAGTVSVATSLSAAIGSIPTLSGTISISGSARAGSTLSASTPQWNGYPTPRVLYQWMQCSSQVRSQTTRQPRGCTHIPGATSLTYQIQSNNVGKYITLLTIADNSYGESRVWSKSTSKVTR